MTRAKFAFLALVTFFVGSIRADIGETVASGAILFPSELAQVPSVRIYYCGQKVATDAQGKMLRFSIPQESGLKRMYLLVTTKIRPVTAREGNGALANMIDHLMVPDEQPYKFFVLVMDRTGTTPRWKVERELDLNDSRYVPDNTLIVLWRPDCIERLDETDGFVLPRVICAGDMVNRFGSEQLLQEFATEMWIEALNSDLFHASRAKEKVRLAGDRVLRVVA